MKQSLKESLKTLSSKEIEEINKAQIAQSKKEAEEFLNAYKNGQCYLCALPFDEKNIAKPCVHWLLNQCDFQPSKDLLPIADHYGYFQIAAFLRWCANAEVKFRNINDLLDEKDARNVISNTIVWKDIEWTFACSAHDFTGHSTGTKEALKPHYHFQMKVRDSRSGEWRPIVKFNGYHLPLKESDVEVLQAAQESSLVLSFGHQGSGMQDAMALDPDFILENVCPADDPEQGTYRVTSFINAVNGEISGDVIADLCKKADELNKPAASLIGEFLQEQAESVSIISPADNVPDIAERTKHKPR